MTPANLFIAALAFIILFGVLAGLFFKVTRVPDILLVMAAGIVLGPFGIGWVTPEQLEPIMPPFTALALLMILFTGGLGLPLETVLRGAVVSTFFSVVVFVACLAVTTLCCVVVGGFSIGEGMLLGAIIGGTSASVVLGLLRAAPISEDGRTLLSLESSITDVLCITTLITLLQLLTEPDAGVGEGLANLGKQFGIGVAVGAVCGFGWGDVARRAKQLRLEFMATLAVVFLTYVGVELAGGSGALAALAFGVVMASSRGRTTVSEAAPDEMHIEARATAQDETRELVTFHDELAFLLRTLFFLVLGVRFQLVNPGLRNSLLIVLLFVGWIAVRWLVVRPTGRMGKLGARDRFLTVHVFPRGMVAAVLASLPSQYSLPNGDPLLSPERADQFVLVSFLVIGLSTIWASVAVFWAARIPEDAVGETAGTEAEQTSEEVGAAT